MKTIQREFEHGLLQETIPQQRTNAAHPLKMIENSWLSSRKTGPTWFAHNVPRFHDNSSTDISSTTLRLQTFRLLLYTRV